MFSWLRTSRPIALLAVALLCVFLFAACGGGSSKPQRAASPASTTSKTIAPPKTVRASRLGSMPGSRPLRPGTLVGNDFSGTRTYATRRDGFALGNLSASEGGPMYPVATTDGGKTWRIAGPAVNPAAASAPVDVAQAGVVNAHTWFMCCGLNTIVDVTPDAGKHWWAAFLAGEVISVVAGSPSFTEPRARLVALVRPPPAAHSRQRLWIYVSANGQLWRYDPSLKSIY
jgi:hypothetical protein